MGIVYNTYLPVYMGILNDKRYLLDAAVFNQDLMVQHNKELREAMALSSFDKALKSVILVRLIHL